jgi:hypothetical protein
MYSQQLFRVRHDEWLRYAETRRLVKQVAASSRGSRGRRGSRGQRGSRGSELPPQGSREGFAPAGRPCA